jgi:hypothetical protein
LQVALLSSVLVRDLAKSAKHMLVVEFTDLEIGSAAERYRTSVAKYLPKPLRALYRGGGAGTVDSSPAVTPPSVKSKGKATKAVISDIASAGISGMAYRSLTAAAHYYNINRDGSAAGCTPRRMGSGSRETGV